MTQEQNEEKIRQNAKRKREHQKILRYRTMDDLLEKTNHVAHTYTYS